MIGTENRGGCFGPFGERLLDTYEAERRRHAAEMIEMAIRVGHVMMPRNRVQAFALQSFFRVLGLYPAARDYFAEMKYKPKPRFHYGFLLDPEATTPNRSFVGELFPQALVMTAGGYQLLDDVLGDGFALIAPPGTSSKLLDAVELQSGVVSPIRRVAVLDKEDASPVETPTVAARDCAAISRNSCKAIPGVVSPASRPLRRQLLRRRQHPLGCARHRDAVRPDLGPPCNRGDVHRPGRTAAVERPRIAIAVPRWR